MSGASVLGLTKIGNAAMRRFELDGPALRHFSQQMLIHELIRGSLGNDGKRRPASDIIVPSNIAETEIGQYLEDLCHEWTTDRNKSVNRVD